MIIRLIILIFLISGCTSNSDFKSDQQVEDEKFTNPEYCTGYINGRIESYWSKYKKYPPNLAELFDYGFNKIYKTCIQISHLKYKLINDQIFLLQYAGKDANFETDDDYYFYPPTNRGATLINPEKKITNEKEKNDVVTTNYCSGYLLGRIESYWKIFGYYPKNMNKINHPYTELIYSSCIPKSEIVYERLSPQNYTLQLPGYDQEKDTHDDFFFTPHYGKSPIRFDQRNKTRSNSG